MGQLLRILRILRLEWISNNYSSKYVKTPPLIGIIIRTKKISSIYKGLAALAQIFQDGSLQIPLTNRIIQVNYLPCDLITNSDLNNCLKITWRWLLGTIAAKPLRFLSWMSSNHLLPIGHLGVAHTQWKRTKTIIWPLYRTALLPHHRPFHLETGGQWEEQILEFCPHQAALWCWAPRNSVRTHTSVPLAGGREMSGVSPSFQCAPKHCSSRERRGLPLATFGVEFKVCQL